MAQEETAVVDESVEDRVFNALVEEPVEHPTEEPLDTIEPTDEETEEQAKPDDPEEAEEIEPVGEVVEIERDGKLYEVPIELKDAFIKDADYTQKTQELSTQRKEVEVLFGQNEQVKKQFEFAQSIQPDVLKAQQLENEAEQAHKYLKENIDALTSTDIEKLRLAIDDARRERDTLVGEVRGKQQTFQQASEQSILELRNKGTEVLKAKIGGWDEKEKDIVRKQGLTEGYSSEELETNLDPRNFTVLWKAAQYDLLQQGKAAAVKQVQDAPAIKPKARQTMDQAAKDRLALNKIKKSKLTPAEKAKRIMESDSVLDRFM